MMKLYDEQMSMIFATALSHYTAYLKKSNAVFLLTTLDPAAGSNECLTIFCLFYRVNGETKHLNVVVAAQVMVVEKIYKTREWKKNKKRNAIDFGLVSVIWLAQATVTSRHLSITIGVYIVFTLYWTLGQPQFQLPQPQVLADEVKKVYCG